MMSPRSGHEVFLHLFLLATGGKDISQDTVDLSVNDQADMSTRDFPVVSLKIQAGVPVNDLILFGKDGCRANPLRKRGRKVLDKLDETLNAAAVSGGIPHSPQHDSQDKKY